jgi:hypothetical protein
VSGIKTLEPKDSVSRPWLVSNYKSWHTLKLNRAGFVRCSRSSSIVISLFVALPLTNPHAWTLCRNSTQSGHESETSIDIPFMSTSVMDVFSDQLYLAPCISGASLLIFHHSHLFIFTFREFFFSRHCEPHPTAIQLIFAVCVSFHIQETLILEAWTPTNEYPQTPKRWTHEG